MQELIAFVLENSVENHLSLTLNKVGQHSFWAVQNVVAVLKLSHRASYRGGEYRLFGRLGEILLSVPSPGGQGEQL